MVSVSRQLHVLFFPLMAQGHMIPMIDIARLFAARGTKSTIITTPLNVNHFSDTIDRDKQSGLDIGIQTIPFPAVEAGLPEGCENWDCVTSDEMGLCFFNALGMLQQSFEKLLEEYRPDCVVSDIFLYWTADVATKYGIPRLLFHGSGNFAMCVVENIKRYSPQRDIESDSEIFLVPALPDPIKISKSQLPFGGKTDGEEPAMKRRAKMEEAGARSFGVVMNSFSELEPAYADYYKKDMGRRTWNIGPVSLYNKNILSKARRGKKASIDDHYCLSWLDSKEPNSVLYVSFGSVSRFGTPQLLEIAKGLEASEIPFIWVVRTQHNKENERFLPEGFEEKMEGKGLIIKDWAPQVLILDHPSVGGFMTHCGWNSILEGISAGMPMITWPIFAEQFHNEKFVTQVLKIGIRAGNEVWSSWAGSEDVTVTKETVKERVTQIMGNADGAKDMRRRARELGSMAKRAVEGGSSYTDLTSLLKELREHSQKSI
nr:glycosyltransferase [Helleborus thibetanus]